MSRPTRPTLYQSLSTHPLCAGHASSILKDLPAAVALQCVAVTITGFDAVKPLATMRTTHLEDCQLCQAAIVVCLNTLDA